MRMVSGDVDIYWYHDTLTPGNVRAASYGCDKDSGRLIPEVGDVISGFHGWDGERYEPITVRVTEVEEIGDGVTAFQVKVTTV
jgi:hypothetical protein